MKFLRFLPALCLASLIFWASSQPGGGVELFLHADKVVHFVVYGLLMSACLYGAGFPEFRQGILWAILCCLYGISDEWHQSFVPGRDATVGDVLADACGAICVLIVFQLRWKRRLPGPRCCGC